MDRLALFLQNLRKLEEGLENLNQEFADLYREFDGEEFADQSEYATSFNSLLESTTHGSASDIGFAREALMTYASYINFRKKYKYLSDSQLMYLIDNSLSSKQKLALRQLFASADNQSFLTTLTALRREWNATFSNKTYSQVKAKLAF